MVTTKTTRQRELWNNKAWHHTVHRFLGETLHYYLLRIRPFAPAEVIKQLNQLVHSGKIGSIRAIQLFGPYDILIRVWLHPTTAVDFADRLYHVFTPQPPLHHFDVVSIERRWYWNIDKSKDDDVRRSLLDKLTDSLIQKIQSVTPLPASIAEYRASLEEYNIIIQRAATKTRTIKFFLAVTLRDDSPPMRTAVVDALSNYLDEEPEVLYSSIYTGLGYCSVLMKAQVRPRSFFEISALGNVLLDKFRGAGISTETYVAAGSADIFAYERIGDNTFAEVRGKNLYVNRILPELYQREYSQTDDIVALLTKEAGNIELSPKLRKLLHDYLLAYLDRDDGEMEAAVLPFCSRLESYLRDKHKELITWHGYKVNEIYAEATGKLGTADQVVTTKADDVPERKRSKRPSLGFLIAVCDVVSERSAGYQAGRVTWDLAELVTLRNKLAHADIDLLREWREPLEVILRNIVKVRELVGLVQSATKSDYRGIL